MTFQVYDLQFAGYIFPFHFIISYTRKLNDHMLWSLQITLREHGEQQHFLILGC